jgi:uncharacterized membrane protein
VRILLIGATGFIGRHICARLMARIAGACAAAGIALPGRYHRSMRAWFWLGWPAFIGLVVVFWLMVAKPDLW